MSPGSATRALIRSRAQVVPRASTSAEWSADFDSLVGLVRRRRGDLLPQVPRALRPVRKCNFVLARADACGRHGTPRSSGLHVPLVRLCRCAQWPCAKHSERCRSSNVPNCTHTLEATVIFDAPPAAFICEQTVASSRGTVWQSGHPSPGDATCVNRRFGRLARPSHRRGRKAAASSHEPPDRRCPDGHAPVSASQRIAAGPRQNVGGVHAPDSRTWPSRLPPRRLRRIGSCRRGSACLHCAHRHGAEGVVSGRART
jgi:hypothetical protein